MATYYLQDIYRKMDTTPTELQQFFGAYFNQDWVDDHACADDVIDTFFNGLVHRHNLYCKKGNFRTN
nr:contact-dependent growth inhibition system immunity protein [Pseudomonas sp. R4-39-08]